MLKKRLIREYSVCLLAFVAIQIVGMCATA